MIESTLSREVHSVQSIKPHILLKFSLHHQYHLYSYTITNIVSLLNHRFPLCLRHWKPHLCMHAPRHNLFANISHRLLLYLQRFVVSIYSPIYIIPSSSIDTTYNIYSERTVYTEEIASWSLPTNHIVSIEKGCNTCQKHRTKDK